VATKGQHGRVETPLMSTQGVSEAPSPGYDDGLAQVFPAPGHDTQHDVASRSRVATLLTGRHLVAITAAIDAAMLLLAVAAALVGAKAAHIPSGGNGIAWLFPPLVIGFLWIRGMYRPKITLRILDEAAHVVGATSVAAMIIVAVATFLGGTSHSAELLARVWVFGMVYVAGGRLVLGLTQRHAREARLIGKRTLIVGAGQIGAQVERRLDELPELGLRPVGYIDSNPPSDEQVVGRRVPVLGGPDDLERIVRDTGAEHVVLAFLSSRGSDGRLVPIVRQCDELGIEVSLVPRLFESINVRVALEHIGGMPLFRLRTIRPKGWQFAVKHVLDRVVAAALIVIMAPLLAAAAVGVKLSSPGPLFFRQRRIGRDGREFDILKFRTMSGSPDEHGEADADWAAGTLGSAPPPQADTPERRTRIGAILRRYSLDELPQLFNVLRGEMSLVGPRPERSSYAKLFEDRLYRYGDRHRVKSGLTGWAQVHGLRGKTSLSDRVEWDNYYIENWSLWLDLKILLMTLSAVLHPPE
jgi:exopolysaccharide biosynthesis polyprenyl glycosylphosphotransferase